MTKREIKRIVGLYWNGVSLDICRTAIVQTCLPSLSREDVNKLGVALEMFEVEVQKKREGKE